MLPENVNWNAVLQSITDTWFPLEDHRAISHNSKCRYGERGAADAKPQPPERCLSRKAGIVRCCLRFRNLVSCVVPTFTSRQ